MSDIQTAEDLHKKFVELVKDYATDLVEQGMYDDESDACEAIVDTHEDSFLDLYKEELTEMEEQWFLENRFNLNFS